MTGKTSPHFRPVQSWPSKAPWGVIKTLLAGILSLGLLPLLVWRYRWIRQMELERQRIHNLLDRLERPKTAGASLHDLQQVRRHATSATTQWLSSIIIGFILVIFALYLLEWLGHESFTLTGIVASTYQYTSRHIGPAPFWRRDLFMAWTLGLSLAYAIHWVAVQWHVTRMQEFVAAINPLLLARRERPLPVGDVGIGLSPRWILGAVIMILMGGYWGIFMMLAGGAQRQYAGRCASPWNKAMAGPLNKNPSTPARICSNSRCRNRLPDQAAYCPRCGWKV